MPFGRSARRINAAIFGAYGDFCAGLPLAPTTPIHRGRRFRYRNSTSIARGARGEEVRIPQMRYAGRYVRRVVVGPREFRGEPPKLLNAAFYVNLGG